MHIRTGTYARKRPLGYRVLDFKSCVTSSSQEEIWPRCWGVIKQKGSKHSFWARKDWSIAVPVEVGSERQSCDPSGFSVVRKPWNIPWTFHLDPNCMDPRSQACQGLSSLAGCQIVGTVWVSEKAMSLFLQTAIAAHLWWQTDTRPTDALRCLFRSPYNLARSKNSGMSPVSEENVVASMKPFLSVRPFLPSLSIAQLR